jgi:EF hand
MGCGSSKSEYVVNTTSKVDYLPLKNMPIKKEAGPMKSGSINQLLQNPRANDRAAIPEDRSKKAYIKKMFERADPDHDGLINKKEFAEMCMKLGFHMDADTIETQMTIFDPVFFTYASQIMGYRSTNSLTGTALPPALRHSN